MVQTKTPVAMRNARSNNTTALHLAHSWVLIATCLLPTFALAIDTTPFRIVVVDETTGRGVPLVELRTVNEVRYVTDSAGVIAFFEPGWMERTVFFHVRSHGYEFPADGFGMRGVRLVTKSGGQATIKIKRRNIAERLYRVTGAGVYRDSVLTGAKPPITEPLLNGGVIGSDSVMATVFQEKVFWFWGDTNRTEYPLGNFHVPGATSRLPNDGGLKPDVGVDLAYFLDDQGFAKATCRMSGEGPTWIDGVSTVSDQTGRERMFAAYAKVKPPLTIYRRGICEFDPQTQQFQHVADIPMNAALYPFGHSIRHRDPNDNVDYIYFADPYATVRVPATAEAIVDFAQYEGFSCLESPGTEKEMRVARNAQGNILYSWKKQTRPHSHELQTKLQSQSQLKSDEFHFAPVDRETKRHITLHRGSVAWNEYRKRWIMIAVQSAGTSPLGEVFYLESQQLSGPWRSAVKIVTHDRYSFYNPVHHPFFDQQQGRFIFFEGTYTHTFSGNPDRTPRYDYNQIMYKLDLADPRLHAVAE